MPTPGNLSLNCRHIKSKKGLFLLVWVFSSFFPDTSVQDNINSCVFYPACCGWKEEGDIIVFCIVEIFKRITPHGLEITRRSMVPHHAHPIVPPPHPPPKKKTKQYGVFLLPRASTSWLHFSTTQTLAVNSAPIKSRGTIQRLERPALSSPARELPGSCTLARRLRSKPSLQRALSNLCQH